MNKSLNKQKHFTRRRKVAEGAKRTKELFFASLCALASLREIVYSFAASNHWDRLRAGLPCRGCGTAARDRKSLSTNSLLRTLWETSNGLGTQEVRVLAPFLRCGHYARAPAKE